MIIQDGWKPFGKLFIIFGCGFSALPLSWSQNILKIPTVVGPMVFQIKFCRNFSFIFLFVLHFLNLKYSQNRDTVYWLYSIQLGWYIHCLYAHVFLDPPKKDYWQMFFHHVVAILLIYSAFVKG